jgi:hypothetical protein
MMGKSEFRTSRFCLEKQIMAFKYVAKSPMLIKLQMAVEEIISSKMSNPMILHI